MQASLLDRTRSRHPGISMFMLQLALGWMLCAAHEPYADAEGIAAEDTSAAVVSVDIVSIDSGDVGRALRAPSERVRSSARLRAHPGRPDSARVRGDHEARERARRERLIRLGSQIRNPADIDSIRGLSAEDKAVLRRRYQILHPLD
jgi:hypothetical protein